MAAEQGGARAPARPLLVRARHVLTCGPDGHVRDGAVAVRADRIAAVGPYERLRRDFPDAEVIGDGTGILTPGLVCTHGHFSEGLVTGIGETHSLWEWFVHVVGPIEPYLTREIALRRQPAQGRRDGAVRGDHRGRHVLPRSRAGAVHPRGGAGAGRAGAARRRVLRGAE